jgi:hypothetical protein
VVDVLTGGQREVLRATGEQDATVDQVGMPGAERVEGRRRHRRHGERGAVEQPRVEDVVRVVKVLVVLVAAHEQDVPRFGKCGMYRQNLGRRRQDRPRHLDPPPTVAPDPLREVSSEVNSGLPGV